MAKRGRTDSSRTQGRPEALEAQARAASNREALRGTVAYRRDTFFAGPLPHPELLAHYDQVCPGCAERIIAMAEKEGAHRRLSEATLIESSIRLEQRGQILAAIIAAGISGGGIYLLALGKSIDGLVALLAPLVGLAGLFYVSLRQGRGENEPKTEAKDQD